MAKDVVKAGKLLIAEPFMGDPNFRRSVVQLCEHGSEGSVGFILNKGVGMQVHELLDGFPEIPVEVFYGGPVQTDTIHYLHDKGDLLEGSLFVAPGIYWGGDFEKLRFLIDTGVMQPENIRFFVGYSGWSAGQLDEEMEIQSWLVGNTDQNYIFNLKKETDLWQTVLEAKGDRYGVIGQMKNQPIWN